MGKRSEELEKHPSLFSDKWDEEKLLSACVALGAPTVSGWSMAEADLTAGLAPTDEGVEKEMLDAIQRGEDPLGDIFCSLRPPSVPVAAVLARAHLRAAGLADRAEVILHDYRTLSTSENAAGNH